VVNRSKHQNMQSHSNRHSVVSMTGRQCMYDIVTHCLPGLDVTRSMTRFGLFFMTIKNMDFKASIDIWSGMSV
jgi:hypothetical protein